MMRREKVSYDDKFEGHLFLSLRSPPLLLPAYVRMKPANVKVVACTDGLRWIPICADPFDDAVHFRLTSHEGISKELLRMCVNENHPAILCLCGDRET